MNMGSGLYRQWVSKVRVVRLVLHSSHGQPVMLVWMTAAGYSGSLEM